MAEKTYLTTYQNPSDSPNVPINLLDNINEDDDDDDDEINSSAYPSIQQPSIFYYYNNGQQNFHPPVSSSSGIAQFGIPIGDDEDDIDQVPPRLLSEMTSSKHVPIQHIPSEDAIDCYMKPKRAKFIGPYLFGDVIGKGSYAKVKECLDRRNLCRRAVKIMQRRRLRKIPYGEKMAATEIRILKTLNHPNIIKLYDFIRNDEKQKLYLFIDLCVVSLQEMLGTDEENKTTVRTFPTWQAHGYFTQLIDGLEYLHSKFIIHNDIKPGNLLITVDHQLKISDFGTAEQLDLFSPDDTIKRSHGTPAFQSPEIANGDDTYSGFSLDIWSSGVTLYYIITGRLPFEADNIYLLLQIIGKGDYTIPDDIEPNLKLFIHGLLNVNKTLRFTIEQIKRHDWFRRRPPRTYEFVPFPSVALNRFQTFTMFDYLSELHRSSTEDNEGQSQNDDNITDRNAGSISTSISLHDHNKSNRINDEEYPKVRRSNRSKLSCVCSRTTSNDRLHENNRNQQQHRLCSLS